jgi:hypothetical protein
VTVKTINNFNPFSSPQEFYYRPPQDPGQGFTHLVKGKETESQLHPPAYKRALVKKGEAGETDRLVLDITNNEVNGKKNKTNK